MLEYFPTNYVWNLSANLALCMGVPPGEVDEICRSLVDVSQLGDDGGTAAFFAAWCEAGDRLSSLAEEDLAAGRRLSAGAKLKRASVYYMTAERMEHRDHLTRPLIFKKMLESFEKFVRLHEENCERVEIPYKEAVLAGLFVKAHASGRPPAPCMMLFNGLDSAKEMLYGSGIQQALARRGISSVSIDQPGTGEALRLHKLPATVETERWAGACVDYLSTRDDIDASLIGIGAWSLGGFYAPRAAAFEKRIKLCVAWGANFDWGEVQQRRLAKQGDRPVPHYWDHVQWVWGCSDLDDFITVSKGITLAPVIDRITVPFLVVHGANDRQISRDYAVRQYEGAIASPKRELKFFTDREGGVEHCSADNMFNVRDYIADWTAETFVELGAQGLRL